MRILHQLLAKEVQGKPSSFKPQAVGYGFRFAEADNVDAVNLAREDLHSEFQTLAAEPLTATPADVFFQKAKTVSELLKKAQTEIQIRKAFKDEKTDLAEDLAIEQPEDVALTVAFGGMNLRVSRKKLMSGDFTGIIQDFKNSIESAMLEQVATISGIDPALVTFYEGIRAIKQVNNPKEFVELVGGIAVNAGSALMNVFKIVKVSVKGLIYTSVPEEVLHSLEKHVERYQDENDIKMAVVVEKVIDELEKISRRGLFPEDKDEREKIIALINSVRHYLDELKKQVMAFNEKFDEANDRDRKALKQKAEMNKALELTLQSFEERCHKLHFWKPLSHNILLGAVRKIESGNASVIETYAGIDISAWLADKVRTASEKFDLKRALDADPEIAMAARTYAILKEHYGENSARNKQREKETFEEIEKEAAFLIALEAQQLRGIAAVKRIAGDLKFTFQQHQLHDATMSSNHYLLNIRKLAVAEALLRSFHLPADQDDWNDEASFQLFYTEIMKGSRKVPRSSFLENVREVAQAKVLSLINTLGKLKSNGATDRDKNHNEKIATVISNIKKFYEKKFNDGKLTQDRITGEWIFIQADSVDLAADLESVNRASLIQAKVQKLLDYEISDRETQKQYIAEIEQRYCEELKRPSAEQKKEVKLLEKQLRLLKHIYRDDPRENIIHKEMGHVSDLGREINERVNGYFLAAKAFEKKREKDIAAKRAAVSKAFEGASASGEGMLANVSNNLRKKIESAAKNAEALQNQIDARHAAVEQFVNKGLQTVKPVHLNPRAAYLADMTPEMVDGFIVRLNEADQKLSAKVNAFVKVGSLVDDFFEERDKDKQKSLMSSSDKERQLYDIRLAREEVAITMLERLLLAQEGRSADLVREAGLVQDVHCEAYRLSSQQIVAYYDFIQRYGTLETKAKVSEKLVPVNHLLEKLSAPLETTWIDYQLALSSEDDDSIFSSAKNFVEAAGFLIDESDRVSLENTSAASKEAEALLYAYEEKKKVQLKRTGKEMFGDAEKIYLKEIGFEKHPKEIVRDHKKKYCERVNAVLSPSKIISTEWGKNITSQKLLVDKKQSELEKSYHKKIDQLVLKEKTLKNRLDKYENATSVGKFFRSITVSFKLGFPPISFSRSDNDEKRKNDLYVAESQRVAEEAAYQEKKKTLELERNRIEKNAKQIAQHLINTIRSEMKNAKIPSTILLNARQFVTEHAPELLQKLDRESDFIVDFLEGIAEGESVDDLEFAFLLIKKFNPEVFPEAKIIFDLLHGNVPSLTEGASLKSLVERCMQALLGKSPSPEEDTIRFDRLRKAVYNNYVEPFIIKQATKNSSVDCEELKSLLSFFSPVKKEIILSECIDIAAKDEVALFHLFDALPAFSEAKNYESTRDDLFRNYFDDRVITILEMANQGSYDEESYRLDLSVLQAAKNAGSSVVAAALDETLASALIMHDDEESSVVITWDEKLAWLVEAYARPETVNQYRLLRLKELCADSELQKNEAKAHDALNDFVASLSQASGLNNEKINIDQLFISELMNSDTPSWIAEAIVLRFGSEDSLRMMHVKWMTSAMARMASGDYEETDKNEAVLHQMILQRTEKNDFDKLEDFIGDIGITVVKEGLQKISEDVRKTHVKPALLVGAVNEVETLSPEAASNIKLAHSVLIDWLRSIPALTKKQDSESSVATMAHVLSEDPVVLRAFAEHDLNVLSKAYYHVTTEEVGMSAYATLDLAHVNKVLLLPPELRAKEKEIWINHRRNEMHREAMERTKLLKAHQDASEKTVISKRNLDSEEFAEEMVEYPFERFIQDVKLHWAENSKNEYNYHVNPDIYYSHYLSQVQPIAERLVREKITDEIFILVEKDKSDLALAKKILRALSEIDKTMILPISRLDRTHVDPIIHLLEIDQDKKAYLRREMLSIAEKYNDTQAIALMNWVAENKLFIPALPGFINASKQAANLRHLMDCAFNYFALEDAFDSALVDFEDKVDIAVLLNQVTLMQNIPALRERADLKIDAWIEKANAHLLAFPLDACPVFSQLSSFVDNIGTSAQKEKMRALVLTKKAADDFGSDEAREVLLSYAPLAVVAENKQERSSPVDGVLAKGTLLTGFDLTVLKAAVFQLLNSLSGNELINTYQFANTVKVLRNMALYMHLFHDEAFEKKFTGSLKIIVDKLVSTPIIVTESTLELSNASGDARTLKYLAALVSDQYVSSYIDVKAIVEKILTVDTKKNELLIKIAMPFLVKRAKELLTDVGFDEDKKWRSTHVIKPMASAMSMRAAVGAAASMSLNSQESPNRKALEDILSLIVVYGSSDDKASIAGCSLVASHETEKLKYSKAMQEVAAKILLQDKKTVDSTVMHSRSALGLFGGPGEYNDEWIKLRKKYAEFAGTGWFSDTGKMFKKNRPYLEVVQEMIDKVKNRSFKENKGSASYETLKALKGQGYFEIIALKDKLNDLHVLDERFPEFRNIVPTLKM